MSDYEYDTYDDVFGFDFPGDLNPVKVVKTVGKGIASGVEAAGKLTVNAVKTAGKGAHAAVKGVGKGIQATGKLAANISDELGGVPVIGPALSGAFELTVGAPFEVAGDVASGKRLDKVGLDHLKRQVKAVKAVGPYVQMVISFVPGVGQGISAGIGAGLALADGQPIDKAIVAAARGAVPGGPLAQAAFDVGIAALEGKAVDQVALQALPLPKDFKKGISASIRVAKDLADGKRVDKALLNEVIRNLPPEGKEAIRIAKRVAKGNNLATIVFDESMKQLPPDARKAMTVGMALGEGKRLQDIAAKELKSKVTKNQLVKVGRSRGGRNHVIKAGAKLAFDSTVALGKRGKRKAPPKKKKKLTGPQAKLLKLYAKKYRAKTGKWPKPQKKVPVRTAAKRSRRGFYLGVGLMAHSKVTAHHIHMTRAQLKGAEKRGFDMALATHVGLVRDKAPPLLTSKEKAGYYITRGMTGARAAQKVGMMKAMITQSEPRSGAALAIQQYIDERRPWYQKFWRFITG